MDLRTVSANEVRFTCLSDGPDDGPLALCLHGFPDTAQSWRHLLPALAAEGYRAFAPWMRGYAPTELPPDGCYQTGALGVDACALHQALGGDAEAVLIGHDWGAAAAYSAAALEPARWRRVVTMAVPPIQAAAASFLTYEQLRRSFYVFLFQTALAPAAVSMDDFSFVEKLWRDWSPGYDAQFDLAEVKKAIADPQNTEAAISYYRAMLDPSLHQERYAEAQAAGGSSPPQPTLYLHGTTDGAFQLATEVLSFLSEGSMQKTIEGAGHFLHLEKPGEVNGHILDFLAGD